MFYQILNAVIMTYLCMMVVDVIVQHFDVYRAGSPARDALKEEPFGKWLATAIFIMLPLTIVLSLVWPWHMHCRGEIEEK